MMIKNLLNISRVLCLAILCAGSFDVAAGQATGTLTHTIDSETANKALKLKVRVASGIHIPGSDPGYPGYGRFVDTEVAEDGGVKYYIRRGTSVGTGMLTLGGKYTDEASLTYSRAVGQDVTVLEVQYEPDRIELSLSPKRSDEKSYGRIKLMTGKGYKDWPAARILAFLDKVFVIPSIDDRPMWVQQYKDLTSGLAGLEAAAAQGDVQSRLAATKELRTSYNKLISLKRNLASVGDAAVAGDTRDYAALAQREDTVIPGLTAEVERIQKEKAEIAKQAHLQDLRAQRDVKRAEISATLDALEKQKRRPTASPTKREADLATLRTELQALDQADNTLQREGDDVTASRAFAQTAQAKADETQREIEAAKGSAAAHGLDVKFQTMAARRSQLTKSYAAAFGTPAADSIKNDLRQLLNQMLANREEAAGQGNGPAKQQASELREALQKLR